MTRFAETCSHSRADATRHHSAVKIRLFVVRDKQTKFHSLFVELALFGELPLSVEFCKTLHPIFSLTKEGAREKTIDLASMFACLPSAQLFSLASSGK